MNFKVEVGDDSYSDAFSIIFTPDLPFTIMATSTNLSTTKVSFNLHENDSNYICPRLTISQKVKQVAKASKAKSLSALSEVAMTEAEQLKFVTKRSQQQTRISHASGAEEGTGSIPGVPDIPTDESREELSWNSTDDEGNGDEDLGLNVGGEEGHVEEEEEDELYRDQQSPSVSSQFITSMLNPTLDVGMESIFETTLQMNVQTPTSVAPLLMTAPTMTPSTIATITTTSQAPILPTTASSTIFQNLPDFGSLFGFDNRLRTLEAKFFEFMQTNQFARAVSAIPRIVQRYMDQRMNEAVKVAVQIQFDRLRDEAQRENDKIEQTMNEQLEAKVLTRSSHLSKTSYAVAADLSKMELKKILIEKIEGNKSIQRSNEQRNLYKALVEAYESDKIILDTYGETVTLKRRRDDDANKDEESSDGPDRGSKRCREGKEPDESAFTEEPMQTTCQIEEPSHPEFDTGAEDQPIVQSSQHPEWFSQQQKPPTLDRDWNKTVPATHESIQPWISELAKRFDSCSSFNELMDTPLDFSNFLINRLKVDTLTPELLVGPTYELMKGSCKSLVELEYHLEEVFEATTDQLDWVKPEGQQYPHNLIKPLPLIPNNRGHRLIPFEHFINNDLEYLRGGALSRKLTNLTIEERFAFNVSLRMLTRSIVIQRHVEDLQLGVESYQKSLNLTKPDSYRSDLKCKEAYTAYSNTRGFIYQNKDKKNRLMRIDELYKFSVSDDRLKGIRMQYLPQSIWRKSDKDRAAAMIQAIDKRLKTRRIGLLEEGCTRETS
nr:hypothetical protein [Tanacetum cinerariifolium]